MNGVTKEQIARGNALGVDEPYLQGILDRRLKREIEYGVDQYLDAYEEVTAEEEKCGHQRAAAAGLCRPRTRRCLVVEDLLSWWRSK